MPLAFYYSPYLVTTLKNYGPIDYYKQLIDVIAYSGSKTLWWQRMRSASHWSTRMLVSLRAARVVGFRPGPAVRSNARREQHRYERVMMHAPS